MRTNEAQPGLEKRHANGNRSLHQQQPLIRCRKSKGKHGQLWSMKNVIFSMFHAILFSMRLSPSITSQYGGADLIPSKIQKVTAYKTFTPNYSRIKTAASIAWCNLMCCTLQRLHLQPACCTIMTLLYQFSFLFCGPFVYILEFHRYILMKKSKYFICM